MRRFRKILFLNRPGLDDSHALDRAVRLAEENAAELKMIEVHPTVTPDPDTDYQKVSHSVLLDYTRKHRRQFLERRAEKYRNRVQISVDIFFGAPFIEAIKEVQRRCHDLIVLAPEKKGLDVIIFGSTDMHLLRKCPCPVWIVKPSNNEAFQNIMAAVDMDPYDDRKDGLNRQIIELASSLARAEAGHLHIAHAWTRPLSNLIGFNDIGVSFDHMNDWTEEVKVSHQSWFGHLIERFSLQQSFGSKLDMHLVQGEAEETIPQLVKEQHIDLLVMGTVARTGIEGFLIGNTAENIISRLRCSLLAVKPEHFICPVSADEDSD